MSDALSSKFGFIVQHQQQFLRRAARRLGAPEQEIDDLIQDTLLIAHQRIPCFEERSCVSTWLYSILRNVLRNHRRGWGRYERKLILYSGVIGDHVDCPSERVLASHALHAFLAELDESKRDVFVLAEVMGCTGREIGEMLAINPNTAVSRLRAARKAFDEWVEPASSRD